MRTLDAVGEDRGGLAAVGEGHEPWSFLGQAEEEVFREDLSHLVQARAERANRGQATPSLAIAGSAIRANVEASPGQSSSASAERAVGTSK